MKKFIQKNFKVLCLIIVVLLIILVSLLVISFLKKPTDGGKKANFEGDLEVKEVPGTNVYKGDKLLELHCIEDICVENVKLYYKEDNNSGRVEFTVVNNSNKKVSGYLKMLFGKESIIIKYKDLVAGAEIDNTTQFSNKKITDKSDYKLEKLTDEEISKIK